VGGSVVLGGGGGSSAATAGGIQLGSSGVQFDSFLIGTATLSFPTTSVAAGSSLTEAATISNTDMLEYV